MWSGIWCVATTIIGFRTWIYETLSTRAGSGLFILMLIKLDWFRFVSLIILVLLMWKLMSLFLRKDHLLRCWGCLSLLNWIGILTLSLLLKLPLAKLELWFVQWSFFLLRFHCISINLSYGLVWTVSPLLAASIESLAHLWNVASLSRFYRYYFGRCLGGLRVILIGCMIFLSPFLDVTRMLMSTVSSHN